MASVNFGSVSSEFMGLIHSDNHVLICENAEDIVVCSAKESSKQLGWQVGEEKRRLSDWERLPSVT
jgi:hypothetical protein